VAIFDPELARRGAIRAQLVSDHPFGNESVFLQKLAHQFQRSMHVSLGLDQHIEDLAFGVDGAPQIDHPSIDFQIGFV
jgi:hypothetical protein